MSKIAAEYYKKYRYQERSLLEKAKNAALYQSKKQEYSKNIVKWIEENIKTYDPRLKGETRIPFKLYPRQKEYLNWLNAIINKEETGLIEKSRGVGISWLNALHAVHLWLFSQTQITITFASLTALAVDVKGNQNSLFAKMRDILRQLPEWQLPEGFNWRSHSKIKLLENPVTGSTIVGEVGDNAGRSGRSSIYHLDEAAHLNLEAVLTAASNNSNVVVLTSTPNGVNEFYFTRNRLLERDKNLIFRYHWTQDPRWTKERYMSYKETYGERNTAQELDINYFASGVGGFIQSKFIEAAVDFNLSTNPSTATRFAGFDVSASEDGDLCVLIIRENNKIIFIDSWKEPNIALSTNKVDEACKRWEVDCLNYDSGSIGIGVSVQLDKINQEREIPYQYNAINGASSPTDRFWSGINKTSKELFYNARAEGYGILEWLLRNTYNYVTGVEEYPEDELISIPKHGLLIEELCQPKRLSSVGGKILIEPKAKIIERIKRSPDHADALYYAFYPTYNNIWGNI